MSKEDKNQFEFGYKDGIVFVTIALSYFVAGKLGLMYAFVNESTTAIWPPTGIALAAILVFGYRVWPAIFIGALFTNLTTTGVLPTSFGIAVGNTFEALVAGYLVNTYANGKDAFEQVSDVFKYILLAVICSTLVSATVGVTTLVLAGTESMENYLSVWTTWWLGDMGGALIVTPFILLWSKGFYLPWAKERILEGIFSLFFLIVIGLGVFTGVINFPYFCIPVLVWIAFRFGRREAITAIVLLACIAIWGTLRGVGPFIQESESINHALLLLQLFMGTSAMTTLLLAVASEERKRSDNRFQSTLDNMTEGFQIIGFDWKYKYVNNAVIKQARMQKDELLNHTMMEKYPGIEDTELFAQLRKCMYERAPSRLTYEFVYPDDSKNWFELRIEPIREGVCILSVDIDKQKNIDDKLLKEKAEDEALLENIGDGIIAADMTGKIFLINKACEDMLGVTDSEMLGRNEVESLVMLDEKGDTVSNESRPLNRAFSTGKKVTATHYLIRKDKTMFPALITATPVILKGEVIGAIKVFHDITQEKEIDRAKTEFVSLASHQLRTPPSIVKWYTELLLKDTSQFTKKQENYIKQISAASQRMVTLVNTLLNVSRLELGTFKTHLGPVSIRQIAESVISELQLDIASKKLKIKTSYEDKLPDIKADQGVITIIFQNLLSNAVKYTPEKGKIILKIVSAKNKIHIEIADTGYGIPKNQQEKIFTKLFRADNIQTKDTQGNGLGLYMVKSILDLIGGEISFTSTENNGTTFKLLLPLKAKNV